MSDVPGLHLLAELEGCDLSAFVTAENDVSLLRQLVSKRIAESGLTELGAYYHFFAPNAVTAVICLAESHFNFHTWPEFKRATVDLFVCNNVRDNSEQARVLFDELCSKLFKPTKIKKQEITR